MKTIILAICMISVVVSSAAQVNKDMNMATAFRDSISHSHHTHVSRALGRKEDNHERKKKKRAEHKEEVKEIEEKIIHDEKKRKKQMKGHKLAHTTATDEVSGTETETAPTVIIPSQSSAAQTFAASIQENYSKPVKETRGKGGGKPEPTSSTKERNDEPLAATQDNSSSSAKSTFFLSVSTTTAAAAAMFMLW